jgi:ribosomal protein S18 acetylase RimI-like enzyme
VSAAITTRPATKADASDIAVLTNIATHGLVSELWARGKDASGTYSAVEAGRVSVLREGDDFYWRNATMAESDGEIVGMLLGAREPDEAPPIPADTPDFLLPFDQMRAEVGLGTWYVSMLGVHVAWRGAGIGAMLLDLADAKRAETGSRGLSLVVEDANVGARRLYERHGYAVRATRPIVKFPSGQPEGTDWLLMVKD